MRHRAVAAIYGGVCHLLFVLAVGVMMGNLYAGLRWRAEAGSIGGALAWDALLLVQFPVLHSLFLTRWGARTLRRLAPRALGATLDTTLYATLASAQVLLLFGLWRPIPGPVLAVDGLPGGLLSAAFVAGWLLLVVAMREAGLGVQTGATGWTAIWRGDRPRYPRGFASEGLHGACRHPIYAAFILILWSGPLWSLDRLLLAVPLTAYCAIGPRLKERRYLARHGAVYADYLARTPWLPPWDGIRRLMGTRS
jgi:protein-S-isoprenylcysteine O-methyltransferase Ste14